MAQVIEMWNYQLQVEKGQEVDTSQPAKMNGTPALRDNWTIVMTDRDSKQQYRMTIGTEMRDWLVRELTGGVILAGGEFPKI